MHKGNHFGIIVNVADDHTIFHKILFENVIIKRTVIKHCRFCIPLYNLFNFLTLISKFYYIPLVDFLAVLVEQSEN